MVSKLSHIEINEGTTAVAGWGTGQATWIEDRDNNTSDRPVTDTAEEWANTSLALSNTKQELLGKARGAQKNGQDEIAAILETNAEILEDVEFLKRVKDAILVESKSGSRSLKDSAEFFAKSLEDLNDEYLSARGEDIRSIVSEAISKLEKSHNQQSGITEEPQEGPIVLLGKSINFIELLSFDMNLVKGICMVEGSVTDHTVIIANQVGIPTIVQTGDALTKITKGHFVAVDGNEQRILADTKQTIDALNIKHRPTWQVPEKIIAGPYINKSGQKIQVKSNIVSLRDVAAGNAQGADGIGLVRTEFLFGGKVPSEQEQYESYCKLAGDTAEFEIALRLFDFGSDKPSPSVELEKELNPALGMRGIRLLFEHQKKLLIPQLRATIRAASTTNIKIMLPMVSRIEEIEEFKKVLSECHHDLGVTNHKQVPFGIMVEVPSIALMIDQFISDVDFISIGTNDLTQYVLGADRTHPKLSSFHQQLHPAVLGLTQTICQSASKHGKEVSVCGELAGKEDAASALLEAGVDTLSVPPKDVQRIKRLVRKTDRDM